MSRAKSSFRSTSLSPARRTTSARFGAGGSRQRSNARAAAATAASTSRASPSGKSPTRSVRSAGLRFSNHLPVEAATHSPPMKFMYFSAMGGSGGGGGRGEGGARGSGGRGRGSAAAGRGGRRARERDQRPP